jgi:hypothetical protein
LTRRGTLSASPGGAKPTDVEELVDRLRARRQDLERAVLARVYGIEDPTASAESEYLTGLHAAVAAALDYAFEVIAGGGSRGVPPAPAAVLVQARLAARNDVGLDSVLRRYCAGQAFLADLIVEEADLPRRQLRDLLRALAASLDHLLAVVGKEYEREIHAAQDSGARRSRLLEGLLAGELLDVSELRYDLVGWHIALAGPPDAADELLALAARLDRMPLVMQRDSSTLWAWLGGRRRPDERDYEEIERTFAEGGAAIGVGEPGIALDGWRFSHRQATAILPVARLRRAGILRYGHAPLVAASLRDKLLATSLRQLFLTPLESERDGGQTAKDTLRAYFAAAGNASSAAAALGVNRSTISTRLETIEQRLGRPVDQISAELQTSLKLEQIEEAPAP